MPIKVDRSARDYGALKKGACSAAGLVGGHRALALPAGYF